VCKEVNIAGVSSKERDGIFEEVEILRKLSHVNIIGLFEAFTDGHNLNIIME
jgi:serine/threonine protein kinase